MNNLTSPAPTEAPAVAPSADPRPPTAQPRLNFHIERLTLPNYSALEQRRFTTTLEAELSRMVRTSGPNAWSELEDSTLTHLDAGALRPSASPEEAARQVAYALVQRLTRAGGTERNV